MLARCELNGHKVFRMLLKHGGFGKVRLKLGLKSMLGEQWKALLMSYTGYTIFCFLFYGWVVKKI